MQLASVLNEDKNCRAQIPRWDSGSSTRHGRGLADETTGAGLMVDQVWGGGGVGSGECAARRGDGMGWDGMWATGKSYGL
jgi:hypothetical protein